MAWLTQASPCMPIMPSESGWEAGKPPRPSSVEATGMRMRSASVRTCAPAPDCRMPWPARMTGFFALRISSAACRIDADSVFEHGVRAMRSGRGGVEVEFRQALLRVLGDVDEHRAGPAGLRDQKGFADGLRHVFGARDEVVVLGDGQRDAGDVHFLEGVGAEDFARDLAGDADHGDGIEHGGGDAGDQVGRAGAGGGDSHTHLAGGARVAVGHVGRALLVAHQDVADGKLSCSAS